MVPYGGDPQPVVLSHCFGEKVICLSCRLWNREGFLSLELVTHGSPFCNLNTGSTRMTFWSVPPGFAYKKSHSSMAAVLPVCKDIGLRSTPWKWIRLKGCLKQHILVLGYISCMLYISYFLQEWQFGVEVPCCTSLVPKSKKLLLLLLLDSIACRKIRQSLKLMG